MDRQKFILINSNVRDRAIWALKAAPDGWSVEIKEPTRSLDQNALFHQLCSDIAKSGVKWAGEERSSDEWKALLISAHSVATKSGGMVIPGLSGEFVAIRESSAKMSKSRASSLIDYTLAWCAEQGIEVKDRAYYGYEEMKR